LNQYLLPLIFIAIVYAAMVLLNERIGLFRDTFDSTGVKVLAYFWLGLFLFGLTFIIVLSAHAPPSAKDLARVPFYSLFTLHAILIIFLFGWWLMTGRPPLMRFLNIQREKPGEAVLTGLAVGVGGWIVTISMALMIALILQQAGVMPKNPEPSAMIAWMASLPLWKKILIVLSAMTVEEAFFRGWLQKRVGAIASTILFALAHSGLGQPFLLIGVAIISLIISFTFYRTKNLIPGIIAHGVFDAVQLFVVIPIAFKAVGAGG
jgi:membrane protease YdiL (CAAX protease family)